MGNLEVRVALKSMKLQSGIIKVWNTLSVKLFLLSKEGPFQSSKMKINAARL